MSAWFKKNWGTRRDETIAFIPNAFVTANMNRRQVISDVLKYRRIITQAISEGMSQGHYRKLGRNNNTLTQIKDARKYRRAYIAIQCAILGQTVTAAKAALALVPDTLPALRTELGNLLGQAYTHEINQLNADLQALRNNPQNFLTNLCIKIQGGLISGAINYLFFYDDLRNEYRFEPLTYLHGMNVRIGGGMNVHLVPHIQFLLYHVRVQQYTAVMGNLHAIAGDLIGVNDPQFMITEQLTGCSFMHQIDQTNMTAIHIQPAGPPAGHHYNLVNTLRGPAVAFGNANNNGALRILGAQGVATPPLDYFPATQVQVVGVVNNGHWEVWAQARNRYSAAQEIINVWQVT